MQCWSTAYVSLSLLLATAAVAVDAEPGRDIAKAIAELAKINGEVDVQYLSHFLRLPNLDRGLKWHGPLSESEATDLDAFYAPRHSTLGSCPSKSTLAAAIEIAASESTMPGYDGGPSFKTTGLSVPQPKGESVTVIFVGDDTCHLTIGHSRLI